MRNYNEFYSTRDIYLAATLISLGFPLESVDYQIEGNRGKPVGYFNFDHSDMLKSAYQQYWNGQLAVEPRAFVTNFRGLMAQTNCMYKNPNSNFETLDKK